MVPWWFDAPKFDYVLYINAKNISFIFQLCHSPWYNPFKYCFSFLFSQGVGNRERDLAVKIDFGVTVALWDLVLFYTSLLQYKVLLIFNNQGLLIRITPRKIWHSRCNVWAQSTCLKHKVHVHLHFLTIMWKSGITRCKQLWLLNRVFLQIRAFWLLKISNANSCWNNSPPTLSFPNTHKHTLKLNHTMLHML